MKIHISGATFCALQEFGLYEISCRGAIPIKGKGTMETYWLEGKTNGISESTSTKKKNQNSVKYLDSDILEQLNHDVDLLFNT